MKLRKIILICVAVIMLFTNKSFCQSDQPPNAIDTNATERTLKAYAANLAANTPLSDEEFTNKMAALYAAYHQEKIDRNVVMGEDLILEHNKAQNIYGKVID
jgi:hypothetical protein